MLAQTYLSVSPGNPQLSTLATFDHIYKVYPLDTPNLDPNSDPLTQYLTNTSCNYRELIGK